MDLWLLSWVLSFLLVLSLCSSAELSSLRKGSFLSVEKPDDVLISPNGVFSAGFFSVGINAFCFAVWINESKDRTVVWMANRDEPVNGIGSKLSLLKTGELILTDGVRRTQWTTGTASHSGVDLLLRNNGNLVLVTSGSEKKDLWQSFDSPTNTLLPEQVLTKDRFLISSRSSTNYSSGYYRLYFDNDNVLRLLYNIPATTSVYWPDPWLMPWEAGRSTYNNSRVAVLNALGCFASSDDFKCFSADFGVKILRRLMLDPDGNLRIYSLVGTNKTWVISWQAISQPCKIHGICGGHSMCSYDHVKGRRCSCLPGYRFRNVADWTRGCEPDFNVNSELDTFDFKRLPHVESFGFDKGGFSKATLEECKKTCLNMSSCRGFAFKFGMSSGHQCYPKTRLFNGYISPSFSGDLYVKMPKSELNSVKEINIDTRLKCSGELVVLDRTYLPARVNWSLRFLLWFATSVAVFEITCVLLVRCFLFRTERASESEAVKQGYAYAYAATGFRRYTYDQLKKATRGFSEEIGRGGGGVVYKGVLPDNQIVAIKRLNDANQGEGEFLAEVGTIGRLNHMNLIEMRGYCAEGKHRLLVYEFMEHGSVADRLASNSLNWEKRFSIAVGTAKGLAYLHEECLEWVLHCDIKPQNILLDSDYQPKVADFGLSKLLNRGGTSMNGSSFSRIRGTRGYMAPEWVYNLPINSKVDVYSYGIVVLEMVTGKSPIGFHSLDGGGVTEHGRLVPWVREKVNGAATRESWMEETVDPLLADDYNVDRMECLVRVALKCVEEDKDSRPTMSQVVQMLLQNEGKFLHDPLGAVKKP